MKRAQLAAIGVVAIVVLIGAAWRFGAFSFPGMFATPGVATTTSFQPMGRGDFTLPIIDRTGSAGKSVTLSDFRGHVIVLEFMEPWCSGEPRFASTLERLYQQYADKGVVFIAVAGSASNQNRTAAIPSSDVAEFIRKYNSSLTYVFDSNNRLFDMYGVKWVPTLFILSKNGSVSMLFLGVTSHDAIAGVIDQAMTEATSYTTHGTVWNAISDGSLDLFDEDGKIAGDLGQPYIDIANVSYSLNNGSLFFRFSLRGEIPSSLAGTHVASIWYQVLLDADSNPSTGYRWSNDFGPDYFLQFYVTFDTSSKTAKAESSLQKYSGTGTDWSWTPTGYTPPIVAGGVGQDFFVLTCGYQDMSVSKGSAVLFFARSGILYDGKVYNDRVPDEGIVSIML
jgi:thiol-disulfide isomerase/thioredoxin